MNPSVRTVLISGGGTGGHIHPALAIADEIRARHPEATIQFVGALGRMEMEKVPAAGYPIEGLWISGIDRSITSLRNLAFPFKLVSSLWKARRLLRRFKPDVVVGVGGFASGPLLDQAARLGIPTLIQEQNSFPGITNRLLATRVDRICAGMPGMERWFPADRIVETGNPLRGPVRELAAQSGEPAPGAPSGPRTEALAHWGFTPDNPVLFVMGGSLGALSMNEAVQALLAQAPTLAARGYHILWQTGGRYEAAMRAWLEAHPADGVHCAGFIDRMDLAYQAADIVASRAGAMSVAELALVGKPAILVPSPHVAEDHQTFNAKSLTERGGAVLLPDQNVRTELATHVQNLLGNERARRAMADALRSAARPDAARAVVDEVEALVAGTP